MYIRNATAKVEKLEKDLKESKASEKGKDKEVDEAWTKMRFVVRLLHCSPCNFSCLTAQSISISFKLFLP